MALVTGAARRIGRAMAVALAEQGASVLVHYSRSADEANEVCREASARGVEAWAVQADFAKLDECEALVERGRAIAGSIEILINNASIFSPSALRDLTFGRLAADVQVNAWAPFVISRAFARQAGRGKIVNLLDSRIRGGDRSHAAYVLSKHLLAVLTKMTALEYAPDITVNAVAPGLILPPEGKDEIYLDRLAMSVPLKRHGQAQDVVDAVLFLLHSDFVTGQVIYVDGGRHLSGF